MPHSIYVKKQFEAKLILMDNNLEPFFPEMVMYFLVTAKECLKTKTKKIMQSYYIGYENITFWIWCIVYGMCHLPMYNQPDDSKIFRVLRWDGGYRGIEQQFHFLSYGRLH